MDNADQKSEFTSEKLFTVNAPMESRGRIDTTIVVTLNPIPKESALLTPSPNPFNLSTTIKFAMTEGDIVTLSVYDIFGREITRLIHNKLYPAGYHSIIWNGINKKGGVVPSGLYFITLRSKTNFFRQKTLLVK